MTFTYSQCHVCHQHAPTCQRSMSAMIALQMTHNYVFRHIQTSAATNKLSCCYPVITKRMTHNFFLPQKLWSLNNVWHISKKLDSTNKQCVFSTFLSPRRILLTCLFKLQKTICTTILYVFLHKLLVLSEIKYIFPLKIGY